MKRRQSGAALLAAMLTVTLVATFASAALWQQFRSTEVESAERIRVQSGWLLTGSLDWARLILREDARARGGNADHLAEPWSVPLNEARLSSFLAVDQSASVTEREAFLSGQITDLQSRLNVANLVEGGAISERALGAFERLFDRLSLDPQELNTLAGRLLRVSIATQGATSAKGGSIRSAAVSTTDGGSLMPQRVEQLAWLGLSPQSLAALRPYIVLLPVPTPVNLNTASAEVIYASTPGLDMADAQRLIAARERSHFRTLADAGQAIGGQPGRFVDGQQGVSSQFFEVVGQLRLDNVVVREYSVVRRDGDAVRVLSRDRGAVADLPAATPSRP